MESCSEGFKKLVRNYLMEDKREVENLVCESRMFNIIDQLTEEEAAAFLAISKAMPEDMYKSSRYFAIRLNRANNTKLNQF